MIATLTTFFSSILLSLNSITGSMGISIIAFTFIMRTLLLPLTLPSIKARKKMKELKPELDKLKKKHKDKKELQLAQMDLYKKYNVNPLGGCLPQLVQFAILIILYRTLSSFLGVEHVNGNGIDPSFLWFNLTQPDPKYILPVLTTAVQFLLSIMIAPGAEIRDIIPNKSKSKKVRAANVKEEDSAEMAVAMQQQMLFVMPIMTGIVATKFPSGLALYWVATNVFNIVQQLVISGPGGLTSYFARVFRKKSD